MTGDSRANWWGLASTDDSSKNTATIRIEKLKQLQEAVEKIPKPEFNVLVFTEKAFQVFIVEFKVESRQSKSPMDIFYGIPIHIEKNKEDATLKAIKLMMDGKRVALVEDENAELHYRRFIPNEGEVHCAWSKLPWGV